MRKFQHELKKTPEAQEALKKLKAELLGEFLAEASVLSKLKHVSEFPLKFRENFPPEISLTFPQPNCVLFLGIHSSSRDQFIVTEFCQNGSVLDFLNESARLEDLLKL